MEVVDSASAAARRRQRRLRSLPSPSTMPHEVRRRQGPGRRGTSSTTRHGDRSRLLQPELFALHEEEPCGARLRPQRRVQRQTVEHIVDFFRFAPMVQVLDAPVPQMVDNPMDAFRHMDCPVAEQVIDVPKISCSSCPSRAVLREPQTGTCGGSADDPLLPQADRCHLQFLAALLEVNKVLSKDRVLRSGLRSRSLTFQFSVPLDTIFLQILICQLSQRFCREGWNQGFFALFPEPFLV